MPWWYFPRRRATDKQNLDIVCHGETFQTCRAPGLFLGVAFVPPIGGADGASHAPGLCFLSCAELSARSGFKTNRSCDANLEYVSLAR